MDDLEKTTRVPVKAPDGARARLAATVAVLSRPQSYPNEVRHVAAIETHMSWVFLTEVHAYKLKKPVSTANFDHATLEARRRACDAELELNRRLAPSVYLAVVPVVSGDGRCVEGLGTPIEWLVKMQRLPRERMLDACIARHCVRRLDIERLGARLTRFYATAERVEWSGPEYRARIAADIDAKCVLLGQPHYGLDRSDVQRAIGAQRRWLEQHGELLEARATAVVDAHGDLRPEHVCLGPDPEVIDCLEFDRDLRLLDPLSELSFLALECTRLGAAWIGPLLLASYAERAGDDAPGPLVDFYQSYHAVVRAAVALWHLDDTALDHSERWRERARLYLRLAQQRLP